MGGTEFPGQSILLTSGLPNRHGGERNVQDDPQAVVRRSWTGYRRVRGNVGRDSRSGGRDGSFDRIQRQQRLLQRGQFAAVKGVCISKGRRLIRLQSEIAMTRFTPSNGFAPYYRFWRVAAAVQLGERMGP